MIRKLQDFVFPFKINVEISENLKINYVERDQFMPI
jgi:hypothetical protein